jgi:hypothetical protein
LILDFRIRILEIPMAKEGEKKEEHQEKAQL